MKTKTITRDEIEGVKILWEHLKTHHLLKSTNFKDHFSKLTFEKRMEDLKKRDRFIGYVAEDNGESIGYCIATVEGLVGEIDSIFVSELYRGRGVGEKLVSLVLDWFGEQNCETIKVSIAEGNESVLGFYRRFGFAERFIVMQKNA